MGAANAAPSISQLELLLSKSSNLFYRKSLTNHSIGGCGEEKGVKGKGNRRSRLRIAQPPIRPGSRPPKFLAPIENYEGENRNVLLPRPSVLRHKLPDKLLT